MGKKKKDKARIGSVEMTSDLYEKIRTEAVRLGVSISDVVRLSVAEYFRQQDRADAR